MRETISYFDIHGGLTKDPTQGRISYANYECPNQECPAPILAAQRVFFDIQQDANGKKRVVHQSFVFCHNDKWYRFNTPIVSKTKSRPTKLWHIVMDQGNILKELKLVHTTHVELDAEDPVTHITKLFNQIMKLIIFL